MRTNRFLICFYNHILHVYEALYFTILLTRNNSWPAVILTDHDQTHCLWRVSAAVISHLNG